MLDQNTVDHLLLLVKVLTDASTIVFPTFGTGIVLEATDRDRTERFKIDVQRKGKKKRTKCTYQMRYVQTEILVRVDIDGPPHENPDGEEVPCPHIHIYREGYADRWARPLPLNDFPSVADLVATLKDFLRYCKFENIPSVQRPIE